MNPIGLAALIVIALQAVVIAALLVERRRRQRDEIQHRAIISSVATDLAVVSRDGHVEACNDNWLRAARSSNPFIHARVGERWLDDDAQNVSSSDTAADVQRIRDALDAVLGDHRERIVECAWLLGAERKWSHFRLR